MRDFEFEREDTRVISITLSDNTGRSEYFELEKPVDAPMIPDAEALNEMNAQEHAAIEDEVKVQFTQYRTIAAAAGAFIVPLIYATASDMHDPTEKLATGLVSGVIVYGFGGEFMPRVERWGLRSRNKMHEKRKRLLVDYITQQDSSLSAE